MTFLLDVNASGVVYNWLKKQGHDVARVSERNIRMSDNDILKWAVKEQRVIVTTDKDFETMIWREGRKHAGILRLENLPRTERIELLSSVLTKHISSLEKKFIVIAAQNKIRIRRR